MTSLTKTVRMAARSKVGLTEADEEVREEQFTRDLLFLIQELGSLKKSADGAEVYITGATCEKAIKDIVRHIHCRRSLLQSILPRNSA